MPRVQIGDKWILHRHLIYCGDTSSNKFINLLPSEAALAIVIPSLEWDHDYLIDKARIVVVIAEEGQIYNFCHRQQMTFQYEFLKGNWYIAVLSHQSVPKPRKQTEIDGIEGIVSFLIDLYSGWNDTILVPFIGNGEVIIACERMGRICVAGDNNPHKIHRSIVRWENWTNKNAIKEPN